MLVEPLPQPLDCDQELRGPQCKGGLPVARLVQLGLVQQIGEGRFKTGIGMGRHAKGRNDDGGETELMQSNESHGRPPGPLSGHRACPR